MAYGDSTTIQSVDAIAFNHIISDPKLLNAKMRGRPLVALLLGMAGVEGYRTNELRREFGFRKVRKEGALLEIPLFSGTTTFRDLTISTATDVSPVAATAKPINVTLPWYETVGHVDVPGQYVRHARGSAAKLENVMKMFASQLVEGWMEKIHTGLTGAGLATTTSFAGLRSLITDGVNATGLDDSGVKNYGLLDRSATGNEDFQSLVYRQAGAFSRTKLAGYQQAVRDRGGNARIGVMNSAEHAALQVQYSEKNLIQDEYSDLVSRIGAPYFEDNGTLFIPDSKIPAGTMLLFDPEDFFIAGQAYDGMPLDDQPRVLKQEVTWIHMPEREDDYRAKIINSWQIGATGAGLKNSAKIVGLTF